MVTDAPVVNPCATCVTFIVFVPCCVANGSASNSISKLSLRVTVIVVAFV